MNRFKIKEIAQKKIAVNLVIKGKSFLPIKKVKRNNLKDQKILLKKHQRKIRNRDLNRRLLMGK